MTTDKAATISSALEPTGTAATARTGQEQSTFNANTADPTATAGAATPAAQQDATATTKKTAISDATPASGQSSETSKTNKAQTGTGATDKPADEATHAAAQNGSTTIKSGATQAGGKIGSTTMKTDGGTPASDHGGTTRMGATPAAMPGGTTAKPAALQPTTKQAGQPATQVNAGGTNS